MSDQDDVMTWAADVSKFLWDVSGQQQNRKRVENLSMPFDDFAYGEALWRWVKRGKPSIDFFSTEDTYLLEFKAELTARFGLPVLTRQEADDRSNAIGPDRVLTKPVNGWLN